MLDALTHGWYRYYVVGELAGQAWDPACVGSLLDPLPLNRHLGPLAWLAAVALAFSLTIAVRKLRRGSERGRALSAMRSVSGSELGVGYEFAVITGLVLAAWFSRLHTGGYINVLMPAYAACGLIGGLAYARVRRIGPLPALAATVLILVQLAQLLALPNHGLPFRERSRSRGSADDTASVAAWTGPCVEPPVVRGACRQGQLRPVGRHRRGASLR